MQHLFRDRRDAGQQLGALLARQYHRDPVVLGLPRGGVPVAYEVALALDAPLDVFVVRKLGVPELDELAMGAIASGGVRVLVPDVIRDFQIDAATVEAVTAVARGELERREREYRDSRRYPGICGSTVIVVDDGVATGASMVAALRAVRGLKPARVIAAAPVLSPNSRATILQYADACEAVAVPEHFDSVGAWYEDFSPTRDGEVRKLLRDAHARPAIRTTTPREVNGIGWPT